MYFTKRQKSIILYLNSKITQSGSEVLGKQIASHMQISLRTLQNEVASINRSCELPIIQSSNKGYFLNEAALEKLHLTATAQEDDASSILKLLLLGNTPLDIDELADDLFLSPSSLQQKFKKIDTLLSHYELKLTRKKNQIYIEGTETQKRRIIHDMIMREIGLTYDSLTIASNYLKNINTVEIQAIILSAIQKHDYFIESCYTTNLVVNILTAFSRIYAHYPSEEVSLPDYQQLPEYAIAADICREAGQRFQISFSLQDICCITLLIMGQIKPISEKTDTTREEKEQAEALIHIIRDTFNAYMLNIDYNIFLSNFIRHIQALLIRARNKQFVINLITENIRETSPFVYDVAVHLAKSLEDFFHIQIIDEEIGLLSIYIGFIIEQSASHSEAVKVLIVCNDYKQIASHILKTLRERHGNTIEILDVIPLPPAAAKYKNAELIIHTLPMNLLGKPSVLISPFCSDLDQEKISQALTSILQHKKHLENQRLLKSYFSEALYFRNQGISCKNDAIRFLGEHVEESGLCSAGFTQSVLKRESMSSTCFMEAFAVPHALELNAQRTCFAVLIEEDGILWDDTRINCVLLIAVCREDRKEFMKIYSGIIQYLFQKEAVDKLTAAPDFHHFINCFNQTA